jgi:hypothetical protein
MATVAIFASHSVARANKIEALTQCWYSSDLANGTSRERAIVTDALDRHGHFALRAHRSPLAVVSALSKHWKYADPHVVMRPSQAALDGAIGTSPRRETDIVAVSKRKLSLAEDCSAQVTKVLLHATNSSSTSKSVGQHVGPVPGGLKMVGEGPEGHKVGVSYTSSTPPTTSDDKAARVRVTETVSVALPSVRDLVDVPVGEKEEVRVSGIGVDTVVESVNRIDFDKESRGVRVFERVAVRVHNPRENSNATEGFPCGNGRDAPPPRRVLQRQTIVPPTDPVEGKAVVGQGPGNLLSSNTSSVPRAGRGVDAGSR